MTVFRFLAGGLLSVLPLNSCQRESVPPVSVQVLDSAGVRIVTTLGDLSTTLPLGLLSDQPETLIGTFDGPEYSVFGLIRSARLVSNGVIAIADQQALDIRFFDRAGVHLRTAGGRGGGPGEFLGINALSVLGNDTLCVWDSRAQRLSLFTAADGFVGTFPLARNAAPAFSVEALPSGDLLVRSSWNSLSDLSADIPQELTIRLDSAVLTIQDRAGSRADTILVFPFMESAQGMFNGMFALQTLPFARRGRYTVSGDEAVGGFNDAFQLGWLKLDGTLRMITRVPAYSRPLTKEIIAAVRAEDLSDPDLTQNEKAMIRRSFDEFPHPETAPAFGTVLPAANGGVWVQEDPLSSNEEGTRWWFVDSSTGEIAGYLLTPRQFDVFEIGADFVLGSLESEAGVQRIALYRWASR